MDQTQLPLLAALRACAHRLHAPFYTPGHKRGQGASAALLDLLGAAVFAADLPELPELDNLLAPQGVIQAAQELAAAAFGAEQTWFLANGSTCGVMAAILATCQPGEQIILPRNVHRSAIAGLILAGAQPIFIQPEYNLELDLIYNITPKAVAAALAQYPEAKAVMLVSPTYHGICADVAAIASIAHQHGVPLLVDEAHGPHFAFHPDLPCSALAAGADLCVQSTHKVLAALTQAAMLHVQGQRINRERITQALQLLQSTSPSYLLLASLDAARQQMALQGPALMTRTLQLADHARSELKQVPGLAVLEPDQATTAGFVDLDRTRLTLIVSGWGISGFTADEILHQSGVTAEFPALQHLTFIISLGNIDADIQALLQAVQALAQTHPAQGRMSENTNQVSLAIAPPPPPGQISRPQLSPREACFAANETVPLAQAPGRISTETICPYPPGVPVLLPGEVITAAAVDQLQQVLAAGGAVTGCHDLSLQTVKVVGA